MNGKESLNEQLNAAKEAYIDAQKRVVNANANLSRAQSELGEAENNVWGSIRKIEDFHKNLLQEKLSSEGLSVCYFANEWAEHKATEGGLSTKEDLKKLGIIPTEETTLLFVKTVVGPADFYSMDKDELLKLAPFVDTGTTYREMFPDVYDYDKLDYRSRRDFHASTHGSIASTTGDIIRVCHEHIPDDEVFKKYHLILEDGLASILPAISIVNESGGIYTISTGENFDKQVLKIVEKRATSSESRFGIFLEKRPEIWEKSPYDFVLTHNDDEYNYLTLRPEISNYFKMPPIYPSRL